MSDLRERLVSSLKQLGYGDSNHKHDREHEYIEQFCVPENEIRRLWKEFNKIEGVQGFVSKDQTALYKALGKPIGEIQHVSGNHIFPISSKNADILWALDEPPRLEWQKKKTTRDEDALLVGGVLHYIVQEPGATIRERLIPNIDRAIDAAQLLLQNNGYQHEDKFIPIDPNTNERPTAEAILEQLKQLKSAVPPIEQALESIAQETAVSYVTRLFPGADPEKGWKGYGSPSLQKFAEHFKTEQALAKGK